MKKRINILVPLLVMFSMQAMNQQKKKNTPVALDKWGLRRLIKQKKPTEKIPSTSNYNNNQASDKWALRKNMQHATYDGKWKKIQTQTLRSK